jgi:phosphatidylinositol alpha 1,6-mannosyltransferase
MAQKMEEARQNSRFFIWARGIDKDRFNPGRRDSHWRQQLGIADDDVVIGYLGRIVLEKGLDTIVSAVKLLEARNTRYRVLVVGDGPARDWLAKELPAAIFTGFLSGDELGRAVASMDVLFNPSVTEAFGNVMLEAMACGLPVLAANATGSEHLVTHGLTGWLEQSGDISAFADRLEGYCRDASIRVAHGVAGQHASRAYEWDEINGEVLRAYRTIVGEQSAIASKREPA